MGRVPLTIWWLIWLWVLASLGGFYVLKSVDPHQADLIQVGFFYALLFFWVSSLAGLVGLGLRVAMTRSGGGSRGLLVANSLRQGSLLGILAVVTLFLQANALLTFWTASLVFLVLLLIELYL